MGCSYHLSQKQSGYLGLRAIPKSFLWSARPVFSSVRNVDPSYRPATKFVVIVLNKQ